VPSSLADLQTRKRQQRFLTWLKVGLRTRFYSVITITLMVIFFSFSVFASVGSSIDTVDQGRADWVSAFATFFELTGQDRQDAITTLESDLVDAASPLTDYFIATPLMKGQIASAVDLMQQWLEAAEPFMGYRLSPEGFVHVRDKNRFFTDDLEQFLLAQRSLFQRSVQTWDSLAFLRMVIQLSGNARLQNVLHFIQESIQIAQFVFQTPDSILGLLGHWSPRTTVLFNQNTAEARPTGGFIGSHIPVTIRKGQVEIGQSQSIYWIQGSHRTPRTASPFLTNYALSFGTNYTLGGVFDTFNFPCFPTSAAFLQQEFAESSTGYTIDEVVFITPEVLNQFLPPDFRFTVPDVGQISGSELLDEIDRLTALEAENPENPKELLTPIFDSLLARIPDIIEYHGAQGLVMRILLLAAARDIQVWSAHDATQNLLSQLDVTGEATCQDRQTEDVISPLLFNTSGDKRNAVTTNSWSIASGSILGGRRVRVQYQQVIENPDDVPRGVLNLRSSFTFVGLQIPSNAYDLDVYSPQSLRRSFSPDFYYQVIDERVDEDFYTAPEIAQLWESGRDLSPDANPPGFVYTQPDSSDVIGVYIKDDMVSTVTFEFTLPVSAMHPVRFVPQAGFRKPTVSLGQGVQHISLPDRVFNQRFEVLQGIPLILGD